MTFRILAVAAAIVAILAVAWFGSGVAMAQDKPACQYVMDEIIADQKFEDLPGFLMIGDEALAGFVTKLEELGGSKFPGVTRAFVLVGPEMTVIGLEVDGCLMPPIYVANGMVPAHLGGRGPDGRFGA